MYLNPLLKDSSLRSSKELSENSPYLKKGRAISADGYPKET